MGSQAGQRPCPPHPPSSPCCIQIQTEVAQGVCAGHGGGWGGTAQAYACWPRCPWVLGRGPGCWAGPPRRSQGNLACWVPGQGPGLPGATGWRVSQLRPRHQVGVGSAPTCLGPLSSASMSSRCKPWPCPGRMLGLWAPLPCPPRQLTGWSWGGDHSSLGPRWSPRAFQGVYGIAQCLYGAAHGRHRKQ